MSELYINEKVSVDKVKTITGTAKSVGSAFNPASQLDIAPAMPTRISSESSRSELSNEVWVDMPTVHAYAPGLYEIYCTNIWRDTCSTGTSYGCTST